MEIAYKFVLWLILIITLGGWVAWKDWLNYKVEEKKIESRIQMSVLEKERMEILFKGLAK